MKYLLVADSLAKIQPEFDTSLRLTAEILRRGIEIDYCDLTRVDATKKSREYLAQIPVQRILACDPKAKAFLRLEPRREAKVAEYAVILQRKDPPVDEFYRTHARLFAGAPANIVQINNPDRSWRYSEHALPMRYPSFSIPTVICESEREFIETVRRQKIEAVAKPENECSGVGVEFFPNDAPEAELKAYWERWKPEIIVQPFIEEVTKSGDLRVLVFNGKIMGQVLRVPKPGSRLANLHQGASWRAWTLTPRQKSISEHIGAELAKEGLYLLGLDFIGDDISEINITSPSAMAQINEVMNQRTEIKLINEIEALRYLKRRR